MSADRERDAMNLWSRGIDWCVFKQGRRWRTAKAAAYDACTAMVLEASRRRALERS